MNNPRLQVLFEGSDEERALVALIDDDNQTYSAIRKDAALQLGPLVRIRTPWSLGEWGSITHSIPLTFVIDNLEMRDDFFVVESLTTDVLIGSSTCSKWGIRVTEDGQVVV